MPWLTGRNKATSERRQTAENVSCIVCCRTVYALTDSIAQRNVGTGLAIGKFDQHGARALRSDFHDAQRSPRRATAIRTMLCEMNPPVLRWCLAPAAYLPGIC